MTKKRKKTGVLTAKEAALECAPVGGVLPTPMVTRSPYHKNRRRILSVTRAVKNCSLHVTLTIDGDHQMIVDDTWPLYSS